jgi:uncharacterized MAPEG superfamily protein
MGIEVFAAVASALFTLFLILVFALGSIAPVGLPTILGNRENVPELTGWVGRAQRAHWNALENLVPFAVIAIAVQLAGASTEISRFAALTFLAARVVHGLTYVAGIPVVRTLAWNVGFAATLATALPLFSRLPL